MTDDAAERERISPALAAWANRDPGARDRAHFLAMAATLVLNWSGELDRLAHREGPP